MYFCDIFLKLKESCNVKANPNVVFDIISYYYNYLSLTTIKYLIIKIKIKNSNIYIIVIKNDVVTTPLFYF